MKKILVPTDFSNNARLAFLYAVELAAAINASVTVVHCFHPTAIPADDYFIADFKKLESKSIERLNHFVEENFSKSMEEVIIADMVEQKLVPGFASDQIVEMSKSGEYEMVVMGATGATGILETVFGKVSQFVAKNAACPVLLVPAGIGFQKVKNIMYASEYEAVDGDLLLQLADFSKQLEANIHFVHVFTEKEAGPEGLNHYLLEKALQMNVPSLKFKLEAISSTSVANGLETYARTKKMDWMVIVKPQRNFWDQLLHRSKTDELINNPGVPLLIMHLPEEKDS